MQMVSRLTSLAHISLFTSSTCHIQRHEDLLGKCLFSQQRFILFILSIAPFNTGPLYRTPEEVGNNIPGPSTYTVNTTLIHMPTSASLTIVYSGHANHDQSQ